MVHSSAYSVCTAGVCAVDAIDCHTSFAVIISATLTAVRSVMITNIDFLLQSKMKIGEMCLVFLMCFSKVKLSVFSLLIKIYLLHVV